MLAPPADKVAGLPAHIVRLGVIVITGNGITVTVTFAEVAKHPTPVPVTVYVVVSAGVAVTDAPVAELNPVDGDQVYVSAPLAVRDVELPAQIETLGDALMPL